MDSMHGIARRVIMETPPTGRVTLLARPGEQTMREALSGAKTELGL